MTLFENENDFIFRLMILSSVVRIARFQESVSIVADESYSLQKEILWEAIWSALLDRLLLKSVVC